MNSKNRSREVMWATAVRILDVQYRVSSWCRLACTAALWAMLSAVEPGEHVRVAAQLATMTLGVMLAFVYARPELIDRLSRLPRTGWMVEQLSGEHGKAEVNLPGLLEGLGVLIAVTAYAGPFAVDGPSGDQMIITLVALVLFAWSVFQNVVMDSGYYAPTVVVFGTLRSAGPPGRPLVWIRRSIPLGLTVLSTVLLVPPWTASLASVSLSLRVLFALSFLTLYLKWINFEATLAASAETTADAGNGLRRSAAQDVHSIAKNAVASILNAVDSPSYRPNEVRGLVRNTLVQLEEIRRAWLRPADSDENQTLHELWEAAMAVLPMAWRARCSLEQCSHALLLASTDRQLARRLLSDLVVNALKANAHRVEVDVRVRLDNRGTWVVIRVSDDGPGMPPGVLDNPTTSLAVMAWELSRYGGGLEFASRAAAQGTTVSARWRSQQVQPPDVA